MNTVTVKEAYEAMFAYLSDAYARTESPEIAVILSEISTLEDGGTADPAFWFDWMKCIEKAKQGKVDTRLRLK